MPRIFTDTTTIKPDGSGTARYAKELSDELHNRSSLVVADRTWSPVRSKTEALSHHRALNAEWIANRTNIQADAAIFPNYFMPLGWPYPSAVTIHDVSFLSHPQFYSPEMRLYYKTRVKHTLRRADLILTVSQASKTAIVKYLDVNPERILVHPPSAPLKPVNPIPQAEQPYLLYVGNLEPKKNIINLIHGFNQLANSEYKLLLAGKLHGPTAWDRKVVRLINSSPKVTWDGYVNDKKLEDYLAFASGLVLLSHVEGFGLPVMDALSLNIPVLISNDPALREVAGNYGICSDANQPDDISAGFEKLIHRKQEKDANIYINSRFGAEAYKQGVSEITDRLVKPNRFFFPSDLVNKYQNVIKETPQETAMLGSIAYASIFKSGIHKDKLRYAMSYSVKGSDEFNSALSGLMLKHSRVFTRNKRTIYSNDIFKNQKNAAESVIRADETQLVRQNHQSALRMLLRFPIIKGLYYSGGTVHGSGLDSGADLDLLVISKNNCAWLSYGLIKIVSRLYGNSDSLCANYIIDEHCQNIHWQQDYYTAFQLLFLKKIALKPGTEHIRRYNQWIYHYFPNQPGFRTNAGKVKKRESLFLSVLNITIMFIWSKFWNARGLRSGNGGLLWDANRIKLHTNDHRPRVSDRFKKMSQRLLQSVKTSRTPKKEKASEK